MSNEPDSEESMPDPDEVEINDPKGRWDNRIVYFIVTAPLLIILTVLVAGALAIVTGVVEVNIVIGGELPISMIWETVVAPFTSFLIIAAALTWLFALMAWFGAEAVIKVARTLKQMMLDFGNGGNQ